MPEGVMPIQRLGLKQGEGAAQVFSFPEVSRDLEYMRQRKAQDRQNELAKERENTQYKRGLIQKEFDKLDANPMWYANPMYFDEASKLVGQTRNTIFDNMDGYMAGDPNAIRTIHESMANTKNRTNQIMAYKDKFTKGLALAQQNTEGYSDEKIQNMTDLGQGKKSFDEVEKEDPNWDWPDVKDIEPYFSAAIENYEGMITQTLDNSSSIVPGLIQLTLKQNREDALAAAALQLDRDPKMLKDIASHYKISTDQARGYYLEELDNRLTKQEDPVFQRYTQQKPINTGRPSSQEMNYVSEVKRDVNEAVNLGDIKAIEKHLRGYGTNLEVQYKKADGTFTVNRKQAAESFNAEGADGKFDDTTYAIFFQEDSRDTKEGKAATRKNIDPIALRPRNYQALLNKIASVNKDVSMEAIRLEGDAPGGDIDAEVARIKAGEFNENNLPTPEQFESISKKLPAGTPMIGPDGKIYVKKKN